MDHKYTTVLPLSIVAFLALMLVGCENMENVLDYADPIIGTDGTGHTFPGATTPFGMVQLSPAMNRKGWNWCAGYHYSDSIIKGFAHTHLSGTGIAGLGDVLLMPMGGELVVNPGKSKRSDGYKSTFSHNNEKASPGYYQVFLDKNQVNVELTVTPRVGLHRYTFFKEGQGHILVDPAHGYIGKVLESSIEIISDTEIVGWKREDGNEGGSGIRNVYFYAKFSKPFSNSGTVVKGTLSPEKKAKSKKVQGYITYDDLKENEAIEVKVALSFVSQEGAISNYKAEAASHTFQSALSETQAIWKEKLSKVEISGSDLDRRIFYTGLYHTYIGPNLISDVDGKFVVEQQVFQTDYPQYSNYSTWDTFRALHPLMTLLENEQNAKFVNSMSSRHGVSGMELPKWEMLGHDNRCMPGYSIVPIMAEAILKNIPGIDTEQAYAAMKHAANGTEKHSPNYGGYNGMEEYMSYSYIPAEVGSSVTKTTEYNYYDWCIAQVAEKLGYEQDAEFYTERAKAWMHLYNAEKGYLWPKDISGNWKTINFDTWDDLNKHYVSGNIWGYSSFVPHDISNLIAFHGGKEQFANWLDEVIEDTVSIGGSLHVDLSGFIGKYGHGDEPSQQLPYLYNYAGKPWKTQSLIPKVMSQFYGDGADGLVNNEDMGQMSAWYVFSALGFYPVNPASGQYIIGMPRYAKSVFSLNNGKTFTVIAENAGGENVYIQSATLNGKKYEKTYLKHETILNGGELRFVMGAQPNKRWGTKDEALPVQLLSLEEQPAIKMAYAPYDENKEGKFVESTQVLLNTKTKEGTIYYTLDGSEPGEHSKKYVEPFTLTSSTVVKAVTVKEGLLTSPVWKKNYVKSIFPILPEGYPKLSLPNRPGRFGNWEGRDLIDNVYGSDYFKDKKWTGVNGQDLIIEVDLGKELVLNELELSTLYAAKSWRFPPDKIFIEAKIGNVFREVAVLDIPQVTKTERKIYQHILRLNATKTRNLKITVVNYGQLPDWHEGAGRLPWIMVDEINLK